MRKIVLAVVSYVMLFLLLVGCSNDVANRAPVLLGVEEDISILQDSSHSVTLTQVRGFDEDGEEFSIVLNPGENYTVEGTVITPITGFIGDLYVPVQLYDSKVLSNTDTMIISVVLNISIQPLYTRSRWHYIDSFPELGTDTTSELHVSPNTVTLELDELTTVTAYELYWKNLEEDEDVRLLVGNEALGQYEYQYIGPYDSSVVYRQLRCMYPCSLNTSWPFTLYKYNVTDGKVYEDSTVSISCIDTAAYIEVPAGIFKCYVYTFSHTISEKQEEDKVRRINPLLSSYRNEVGIITETFYYSPGVGYIQYLRYNGTTLILKKVLSEYYVEESLE